MLISNEGNKVAAKKKIEIDGVEYIRSDLKVNQDHGVDLELVIGNQYVIETPTKYWIGTLAKETDTHYILVEAAWLASTGDFSDFCGGAAPAEMEPLSSDSPLWVAKGAECAIYPREISIELVR